MKKFISGVLSGVILSSAFAFGGETTITDSNLLYVYDERYVCYTTLENIVKDEYSAYLKRTYHNENDFSEKKFELSNLKQLELFDEFKVAKQIAQKIDKQDNEIEKMLNDRYSKIRYIAMKMGCVEKDKVKLKGDEGYINNYNKGYIESVTFPNSLKEVYETMSKELDNLK